MIAADTSSFVAYFNGEAGTDVERVTSAMNSGELVLPPAVITELLTDPRTASLEADLRSIVMLEIKEGYWLRAGLTRRTVQRHGLKAKVGDALIAQSCIDHDVALITRDKDFRHFARHCGLKLA
jgi:predicted nucleic acid-binding protein